MLHAPLRLFRVHSIALLAVAVGAALLPVSFAAAQGTVVEDAIGVPGAQAPIDGVPEVPPLPEGGTPAELLAFIAELKQKNFKPRSREEMMGYVSSVAANAPISSAAVSLPRRPSIIRLSSFSLAAAT